jgi:hypothetical protein
VLVYTGIVLAALSNPDRFSLNVSADRQIDLLSASGFVCTTAGIGLLLKLRLRTAHWGLVLLGALVLVGVLDLLVFLGILPPSTLTEGWTYRDPNRAQGRHADAHLDCTNTLRFGTLRSIRGLSPRKVPLKGFRVVSYISFPFPKLCLAQSM